MKVITLTLNPAFDIHCKGNCLIAGGENFAEITVKNTGGKGLNISRGLTVFGVENIAYMLLGEENGDEFENSVKREGIEAICYRLGGRIRENITHRSESAETRLSFSGFSVGKSDFSAVEKQILALCQKGDVVTLTGSLPKGVGADTALALAEKIRGAGARLVIDCRSLTMNEVIAAKPYLIKPNLLEISDMTGKDIKAPAEAAAEAIRLDESGVENAMISLGGEGAVLACSDGVYYAKAPKAAVKSTVGAGDSMIAGFLYAISRGFLGSRALEYAVAFGTAACMRDGTSAPDKDAVCKLKNKISATEIMI